MVWPAPSSSRMLSAEPEGSIGNENLPCAQRRHEPHAGRHDQAGKGAAASQGSMSPVVIENPRSRLYHPPVLHRHLTHQQFTLAAIDDVIARGKRRDWAELRSAVLADPVVLEKALQVCQAHVADPSAQRYHFWKQYAERHLA